MQINSINSNQNFGMAIRFSPEVQKVIAKKIKKDSDIQILDSLVQTQEKNPFKVDIREESGNIKAYIWDTKNPENSQLQEITQNFFEKHFQSPLAFIKRCCKKSDKMNEETYAPNINPKLKSIFEKTKDAD